MTNDKGPMTAVPHSALVAPVPALVYGHGCPQVSGAPFSSAYSISFDSAKSYPQRRMAIRPCKNHQIRVKIDQKGDVFRQKGIKKARISSCPS
jgi:hypothetical protein